MNVLCIHMIFICREIYRRTVHFCTLRTMNVLCNYNIFMLPQNFMQENVFGNLIDPYRTTNPKLYCNKKSVNINNT